MAGEDDGAAVIGTMFPACEPHGACQPCLQCFEDAHAQVEQLTKERDELKKALEEVAPFVSPEMCWCREIRRGVHQAYCSQARAALSKLGGGEP